jgi:NAD(P)-dependent dehydrogenase (short-subunit alcohol dehydrogenase family)
MRGLAGKVVVVAGAGSGIGAATARRLGAEGAAVVVGDLNGPNADTVAAEVRDAGGRAISVTFDIADDASVAALVAAAVHEYGGLDAMHANAADLSPETIGQDSNALEVPMDVFMHTLDVNLKGHLLCTRHALPRLLERGGGALLYTSSAAGHIGEPERPSYAASKAGINSLVRHVASHWGRQGVRANSIAPGLVVTPAMDTGLPSEFRDYALRVGRSPRLGRPDDIAGMVAFLVSDDGEWVNGQVLSVDGGASMRP